MIRSVFIILAILTIACTKDNKESKLYASIADKQWVIDAHGDDLWRRKEALFTVEKTMLDLIEKSPADNPQRIGYYLERLIFKADGTVTYARVIKNVGLCGNGLMSVNKGSWKLDGNKLNVDVAGSYSFESDFHYKIEYEISFPEVNRMKLTKIKNKLWEK